MSTRVYRVQIVTAFMRAGIPLAKIDSFREILQDNAYSLSSSQHLRDLIPFVLKEEKSQISDEISGQPVSVIFDGTTHVCEAMAMMLRYVDSEWNIQQRLVRLLLLAKSLTGEEVARL